MRGIKETLQRLLKIANSLPLATIVIGLGRWLERRKFLLFSVLLGIMVFRLTWGRLTLVTLQGQALGEHYHIQYLERWGSKYKEDIEALLTQLTQALDSSLPDTEIAQFNQHDCSDFEFSSPFLYALLAKSKAIHRSTQGVFDPTIFPLVQAWEHSRDTPPNAEQIRHLKERVGLDFVVVNAKRGKKLKQDVQIDLRGILKGYVTDQIAHLLHTQGIEHLQVTLGDQVLAHGKPSQHNLWHTSIHPHIPALADDKWEITLDTTDKSIAVASRPLSVSPEHSFIDPATGRPAQHTLLAVAVVAPESSTANAFATAMMVRGLDFAKELLAQQEGLDALLIYQGTDDSPAFYASSGLHMQQDDYTITLQSAYSNETTQKVD